MNMRFHNNGFYTLAASAKAVWICIGLNIIAFVCIRTGVGTDAFKFLGLVPQMALGKLFLWQFVTYLFLHAGIWHLAVNMGLLGFFGPSLEKKWGSRYFAFYYLVTGFGAGLFSLVVPAAATTPIVGASGSVFGIMIAYAIFFPSRTISLFFMLPIKVRHAVIILTGFNIVGAIWNSGNSITYIAHLGGGLFGYILLRYRFAARFISTAGPGLAKSQIPLDVPPAGFEYLIESMKTSQVDTRDAGREGIFEMEKE